MHPHFHYQDTEPLIPDQQSGRMSEGSSESLEKEVSKKEKGIPLSFTDGMPFF